MDGAQFPVTLRCGFCLTLAKVDTDRARELARDYRITSIPTVILFQDGQEAGRSIDLDPDEIRGLARGVEAGLRSPSPSRSRR